MKKDKPKKPYKVVMTKRVKDYMKMSDPKMLAQIKKAIKGIAKNPYAGRRLTEPEIKALEKKLGYSLIIMLFLFSSLFSFAQQDSVRTIILQGDTLAVMKPHQLRLLNGQLSLLSSYKLQADKTISKADSLIENYKRNQRDLNQLITNKDSELSNKDIEIANLNKINHNNRKRGFKNALYSSAGTLAIGLIAGILIAK